jgi:hypothetical protein
VVGRWLDRQRSASSSNDPRQVELYSPPFAAAEQASKLSADHILQHRLIERQIDYDLLQLAILLCRRRPCRRGLTCFRFSGPMIAGKFEFSGTSDSGRLKGDGP